MSEHHRSKEWFRARRIAYPILLAQLPSPCPRCGFEVNEDTPWQVGHIIAHMDEGSDDLSNLGAEHKRCNLSDGGRRGAAITNSKRRRGPRDEYPY